MSIYGYIDLPLKTSIDLPTIEIRYASVGGDVGYFVFEHSHHNPGDSPARYWWGPIDNETLANEMAYDHAHRLDGKCTSCGNANYESRHCSPGCEDFSAEIPSEF